MAVLRAMEPGDAGWLIMQHGAFYAEHYGFNASFEALVAEILADFLRNRSDPADRAWIAADGDTRLGSIFCVRLSETTAKLRLFYLVPEARGNGLGRHLLDTCLAHARGHGFTRMELWTHAEHTEACALYAKAGFTRMSSKPVTSFGVELTEEMWGRDL